MRTKDRVVLSALSLFATQGFQATGIRQLASHAGVSLASLYHHIGTKDDLLAEIMSESLERLTRDIESVLEECGDPLDALAAMSIVHVMAHALRRERTIVVDTEMRSLTEDRRPRIVELRDAYEERWRTCIDAAGTAGLVDVRHASVARLAMLDMLTAVATWYSPDGDLGVWDICTEHADLVLGMLRATRDGRPVRVDDCNLPAPSWFEELVGEPDLLVQQA